METIQQEPHVTPQQDAGVSRPVTWLAGLTAILLLLNVFYFLNRNWEDSYWVTSYSTIYYPADRPIISGWAEVDGGIEAQIVLEGQIEGWTVTRDGEPWSEAGGKNLFIKAPPESDDAMHRYVATPRPAGLHPPVEFDIRFLPRSFHEARGLPRSDTYIIRTDLPTGKFGQLAVSDWVDDFSYETEANLEQTDRILVEQAGINARDPTFSKLEKLMAHLRIKLGEECRGTPPLDSRWKTPYQLYTEMESGAATGWCTQFAQAYVYFANRAGLATRLVQGARTQGNTFIFTGHTWVEAWIPEQGRWAWVEPSFGQVYVTDKKGQVLNTVELANLRQHNAWDGVTARVYKDWGWPDLEGDDGTFVNANFTEVSGVVERQFLTSAIYKWRRPPNVEDLRYDYGMVFEDATFFWGNLERYFFKPPLAYSNYPAEGNRVYVIRHALLWGFLLALVATALAYRRRRSTIAVRSAV